jgi:prepilin-type N-terminal cleavage/methylation domain-containing protein
MYESLRKARERKGTGEGGFTLIEILIIIVILGILAAIVVLAIGGLAGKSKTAACDAEEKTIVTAEDAYHAASADAQGKNATYGTLPQLSAPSNPNGLLKDDPTGRWGITAVTANGYTLTGVGNCDGIVFNGPPGP